VLRHRRLARGDSSGRGKPLGLATMIVAALVALAMVALVPDGPTDSMRDLGRLSVAPVEVAAVVAFVLGVRLWRRARALGR